MCYIDVLVFSNWIKLSLSILVIMANAQTPSNNSTAGTNSTTSNETNVKQMRICQVGVKSPCNSNSVQ